MDHSRGTGFVVAHHDLIASLQKLEAVWLREDLERVSARLEGLNANLGQDFEHVDKSLADIEHFLDNSLLTNSDKTHLRKIETEVAEQLKAYKAGMDDEAYSKTFELMLLKRLREEYKIPRLTLFYL
jgi:predicted nuclease with TOPRIM domain